ncbi:DEAD/DEAH box helicase [Thermocrinis sp.]|uniref:DEAD/DEAH box helicase n=1 Tax=Thermocrinis sp. TaxID=2024383 RepID=UPI002FDCA43A
MQTFYLLPESTFKLNPPSGEAVYRKEGETKISSLNLIPAYQVDERIPYTLLNPLQTLFYHTYNFGNAIVSAPTSAGKSLTTYLFFRKFEGRKVYTAPTKALVYEKAVELRRFYQKVDVRTGDKIVESFKDVSAQVVVCTYESLVQAFRNSTKWTKDIQAVVVDEIHQIKKRWVLEELLVYAINKNIALLGLSATMPGVEELSRWIKASLLIKSQWRPVPLERQYHALSEFVGIKGDKDKALGKLWDALWHLSKPDEKVILFVPQKQIGWNLLELANNEKIGIMNQTLPFEKTEEREPEIAFHNADVPKEEREAIEKEFRDGDLRFLIATQTLAYGVNLPADRVLILVKIFKNKKWMCIPDELDILQMEGRVGRLGLKEKGYSHIIIQGGSREMLEDFIQKAFSKGFTTTIQEEKEKSIDALSFFILLGYLYEGANYKRFLEKFYSFKKVSHHMYQQVERFLKHKLYVEKDSITPKGAFCIKNGVPPTRLEEFIRRQELQLPKEATIRPLLYTKRFDTLYDFVKKGESFKEDDYFVRGKVALCGENCFEDNTHQFIFYTEGLTFKYPNLKNPPGEFSYLGTEALHLLRTLWELRKSGFISMNDLDLLSIAHSVKFGVSVDYASLAGVKGIGHIRANLIKRTLHREGLHPPPILEQTSKLLDMVLPLEKLMLEVLIEDRKLQKNKAKEDLKKLIKILENNRRGRLIDDKILLMFGFLNFGEAVLSMRKEEIISRLIYKLF